MSSGVNWMTRLELMCRCLYVFFIATTTTTTKMLCTQDAVHEYFVVQVSLAPFGITEPNRSLALVRHDFCATTTTTTATDLQKKKAFFSVATVVSFRLRHIGSRSIFAKTRSQVSHIALWCMRVDSCVYFSASAAPMIVWCKRKRNKQKKTVFSATKNCCERIEISFGQN